jgi:adenylosuccinate lyase
MCDDDLLKFANISPLDARYSVSDPAFFERLRPYLSEQAAITYQLKVEQAIIAQLEASGVAPRGTSAAAAEAVASITCAEVYAEEQRIQHNIRALVNCIRSKLPEPLRGYVHLFATSNDVTDTARAVALRDACREVVIPEICALVKALIAHARDNAETPQIGRTHGQHAEPVTVGYWLANYVQRLGQRAEFVAQTAGNLRGKFSGAVGAHNALSMHWPHDPATVEQLVLARLGLRPADSSVSTQIVHPEYLTDLGHALVSTFSVFANLADDFRHIMRSEIAEAYERGGAERVGSSTMPHKVNPKDFENVKSLWKAFMPRMVTLYLDQISEHQRDLTNSASGRFFNELVAGVAYAGWRLTAAVRRVEFNHEALRRNLLESSEWIVAEPLYIALALAGHPDPYDASRSAASSARKHGQGLLSFLKTTREGQSLLGQVSDAHREIILDPCKYVGDAASRTVAVCEDWEVRIDPHKICARLQRPPEGKRGQDPF